MNRLKQYCIHATLIVIVLLVAFSIYGAFLGAERAHAFFNSVPLVIYWFAFLVLVTAGLIVFRSLRRIPSLLLMHLGCIAILLGSLWGSQAGHEIAREMLGREKYKSGRMAIYEGQSENRFMTDDGRLEELPFEVGLQDFRIDYYPQEWLIVSSEDMDPVRYPAQVGPTHSLPGSRGTIRIVQKFSNFKITNEGGQMVAKDSTRPGHNPALQVEIINAQGNREKRFAFANFSGHMPQAGGYRLTYLQTVKDYVSDLQIVRDGEIVAQASIEVNHPLHYGGYHFYQTSYDEERGEYTILDVVSDSGLYLVYAGFWMLCVGVFWRCWVCGRSIRKGAEV